MRKLFLVAIAVALLAAACGDDSGNGGPGNAAAPPVSLAGKVTDKGIKALGTETTLEMEADDEYFGPTFVTAKGGSTISVTITNTGKESHTFTIDGTTIDKQLSPGQKATVDVAVPATGSLSFYCRFHKGNGMQGAFAAT